MVSLVVDRENVLQSHEFAHYALQHLAVGFDSFQFFAPALQQRAATLGEFKTLPRLESVEIGDNDLGLPYLRHHVLRHEFTVLVVAVRVVGLKHPQAVANRDAWSHNQKSLGKSIALRVPHRVDGLPGDQHGHDRGFSRPGRQLERKTHQLGICLLVGIGEVFEYFLALAARLRRDFGEPDRGLGRFHLTEERSDSAKPVISPVLKKPGGFGSYAPLVRIGELTPGVHLFANAGYERGMVVFLFLRGQPKPLV